VFSLLFLTIFGPKPYYFVFTNVCRPDAISQIYVNIVRVTTAHPLNDEHTWLR